MIGPWKGKREEKEEIRFSQTTNLKYNIERYRMKDAGCFLGCSMKPFEMA